MTPHRQRRTAGIALGVWTTTMLVVAVAVLLPVVTQSPRGLDGFENWEVVLLLAIANTTLGAVIVSRRPQHPIGWLLAGSGGTTALQLLAGQYAGLGPGIAVGVAVAAWSSMLLQVLGVVSIIVLFQLFPTGRPVSPRWWVPVWATVIGLGCSLVAKAFAPGPMDWDPSYANPAGVADAAAVLDGVGGAASLLIAVGIAGGLASLGLRFRHADGIERQQVKLLFYAATVGTGALVGANVVFGEQMEHTVLGDLVWGAAALSLSLAVTIAILRYRLYDIDRLIRRTVTYAAMSLVLLVIYAAIAVAPVVMFDVASDLLVAAATLAAAAVFRPLRRKVQTAVDRRFNRRRYDAVRTVEAFGIRLRGATDRTVLGRDLAVVVHETVEPTHVSVWLAPTHGGSSGLTVPR